MQDWCATLRARGNPSPRILRKMSTQKNHLDYSDTPLAAFNGESERSIWKSGFNHAADIPRFNLDMLRDGMEEDDARDVAFAAWAEAESNSRQYSPWEFTAKAINDMPSADRAWEIYEEGIAAAFEHGWNVYVLRRYTFAA